MVNTPAPETAGLKVLPDTPVPVKVPPVGEPVNVMGALVGDNAAYVPALTVGSAFTVKFNVATESQPTEFVVKYEYVPEAV